MSYFRTLQTVEVESETLMHSAACGLILKKQVAQGHLSVCVVPPLR